MTVPPDAGATPPGEWIHIGDITTANGQILIIANHAHEPEEPDAPADSVLAYNATGKSRSADGRIISLVAEQIALDQPGGHAYEDALIIRTWENGMYAVDARRCAESAHDGWCELRVRLHNQVANIDLSDVEMAGLTMSDDEKRALAEHLRRDEQDDAED